MRIASEVPGKIVEVLADTNDKVDGRRSSGAHRRSGNLCQTRGGRAEAGVRERERQEEAADGPRARPPKSRRRGAAAERNLFAAREAFDAAARAAQGNDDNKALADKVAETRKKADDVKAAVETTRAKLAKIEAKPDMPLETRLESSLSLARADLSSAEIALERTRVRAPTDGTVLNMLAKVGETAVPSPESALLVFGDLSSAPASRRSRRARRRQGSCRSESRRQSRRVSGPRNSKVRDVHLAVAWHASHRDAWPATPERRRSGRGDGSSRRPSAAVHRNAGRCLLQARNCDLRGAAEDELSASKL